ncbi:MULTISPECIES: ABC transporter permease [unclassified Cetobacterium]|uniref:ABC transporter permease n=1 Tax=unclassified Cetobacterium TaxID=2630983 RepID=UPI000A903668|nr:MULTISPECIES: ABC transporter permease [unclassified Cetobacterium]
MKAEILEIVLLSLVLTGTASIFSSIVGFFISLWLFFRRDRLYKKILDFFRALTGVPTIIFGLLVLLLLSRRGLLGPLNLLFTPTAIVIAQFLLLLPLVVTLCSEVLEGDGVKILTTCKILHIPKSQLKKVFFRELKTRFLSIFLIAFARGISEVGSVMLVGGNIKGSTRVMTTYIALSTSMGNYNTSLIIALILFLLSFSLNILIKKVS